MEEIIKLSHAVCGNPKCEYLFHEACGDYGTNTREAVTCPLCNTPKGCRRGKGSKRKADNDDDDVDDDDVDDDDVDDDDVDGDDDDVDGDDDDDDDGVEKNDDDGDEGDDEETKEEVGLRQEVSKPHDKHVDVKDTEANQIKQQIALNKRILRSTPMDQCLHYFSLKRMLALMTDEMKEACKYVHTMFFRHEKELTHFFESTGADLDLNKQYYTRKRSLPSQDQDGNQYKVTYFSHLWNSRAYYELVKGGYIKKVTRGLK
jgi:hypothetical protein